MDNRLITLGHAAKELGVSVYTIRNLVRAKRLDGRSFGPAGRVRYITRSSLENLVNTKENV